MPKGRATKLTPELSNQLVGLIGGGCTVTTACEATGIVESSFYLWVAKGDRQRKGIYTEFSEAIRKARGTGKAALIARIQTAASTDWRAAAWMLERARGDEYSRQDVTTIQGPNGGPVPTNMAPPVINVTIAAPAPAQA